MTDDLDSFERALLGALTESGDLPPAGLAVALDSDLGRVLEATAELQRRGLLERHGFDTCRLTEHGRALTERSRPA